MSAVFGIGGGFKGDAGYRGIIVGREGAGGLGCYMRIDFGLWRGQAGIVSLLGGDEVRDSQEGVE